MQLQIILVLIGTLSLSLAHEFRLRNNCPFTVWPGLLGNPGKETPLRGGFQLNKYESKTFHVGRGWGGRIWPRRDCDGNGHCVSGDCGNKIECNGAGGVPPASLAEFTLDGWGDQDYYDVSLVDGYNLPIKINLIPGTYRKTNNGKYDCTPAGCYRDLNEICPNELAVKQNGWTVACKSACAAFNTDEYCCRGAHNTPQTCKSSNWPHNYPAIYKQACPEAYSYAYDDELSTFTCHGNPETGYEVVFCP
ncbi:unnamed protein product [Chironomus riparius]|uniref:Thaumatin-like protein n=1 Tax=Chironomus riparius TaxID=315576 RepID=A0A9N9S118_9DIPT|nr:unnamed protein product [Chironomus riparius]